MKQRTILITNDDGIWAPGLQKLAEIASQFGNVWIAAPAEQCSGMSHKMTFFHPIPIQQVSYPLPVEASYRIGGTPADCVKIALTTLIPEKPDVVLSGINSGYNAGFDIAYSGTLGAAMEALMNDIPAIALSTSYGSHYELVDQYLPAILKELLALPPSTAEVWNVNFPGCAVENCQGIARNVTPAPISFFDTYYTPHTLEDGSQALMPAAHRVTREQVSPGTDIYALLENQIAIGQVRCYVK